jgi:hypothetical protein
MAGTVARRGDAGTLAVAGFDTYPALADGVAGLVDTLEDNVGDGLKFTDLTRITVPTGGGTSFEVVDDLTGERDSVRTISGVLVHWQHSRVWWEAPKPGEPEISHEPPACSSVDGKVPVAGGAFSDTGYNANLNLPVTVVGKGTIRTCAACPMNEWGSTHKEGRRGKACKQQILMYLLPPDEILPIIVSVSPTSLAIIRNFMVKLSARYQAHHSAFALEFSLKRIEKSGSEPYSQLVPKLVAVLDGMRKGREGPVSDSPAERALQYSREFAKALTVEDIINASTGNGGVSGNGVVNADVLPDDLGGDFAEHEAEPVLS